MAAVKGGVKDRIIHEIGRAIKQAQVEWCLGGGVRGCTGHWLVVSLDAALLHGLTSLATGYWPAVVPLLDRISLATITALPYATTPLARGRSWVCLCLNEGQMESYLHALTSHQTLLEGHYSTHALLRDPHRAHILLMMVAGLEHLRFFIPMEVPGWIQTEGSAGGCSASSCTSLTSSSSSSYNLDTTCSEALEETWMSAEEGTSVSDTVVEDTDTAIEILHVSKTLSRRKRCSQSSSQSSSQASFSSNDITPTGSNITRCSEGRRVAASEIIVHQLPERACDIYTKESDVLVLNGAMEVGRECVVAGLGRHSEGGKDRSEENRDNSERQNRERSGTEGNKDRKERLSEENRERSERINDEDKDASDRKQQTSDSVVIRRRQLPGAKNTEKRVSFTDSEGNTHKAAHSRLSLVGESGRGLEIRDLSDLKDLLSALKEKGLLLPLSVSLDDLFTGLDQTSPMLSERAPPEGQEDPPLHQSITSLTPTQQPPMNNNNNNSINDDSNNNSSGINMAGFLEDSVDMKSGKLKDGNKQIGCFAEQVDILSGVRWEELTKIGKEMLKDEGRGLTRDSINHTLSKAEQEHKTFGFRPKLRQRLRQVFQSLSENSSQRGSVASEHISCRHLDLQEKRQAYRQMYRQDKTMPYHYIPAQVDPTTFKGEELHLALEVAQGQSNTVLPGHTIDPALRHRLTKHLFSEPSEDLYRLFSVREDHSSGSCICVWVVLSSRALYVVTPAPRGVRTRHTLPYTHLHTIIVGANNQWVCLLSKRAVEIELSVSGVSPGIHLEVGDPDITHSFMSCLDLAIRRHLSSIKAQLRNNEITQEASSKTGVRLSHPARKLLQDLTRECADNFSNSLLEESLLNAWEAGRKLQQNDMSPESEGSQDSSLASPVMSTHEEESCASRESVDYSHASSDASNDVTHESSESSDMSNNTSRESVTGDQSVSEASSISRQSVSRKTAEQSLSQPSVASGSQQISNASHASADLSLESTEASGLVSNMSRTSSTSDETPTSSDMLQSLSSLSEVSVSQASEHTSEETGMGSRETVGDAEISTVRFSPVRLALQDQERDGLMWGLVREGRGRFWNKSAVRDEELPAVVIHPAWELAGMHSWLSALLHVQSVGSVCEWWLVDWEDGSSLGGGDAGPLGPTKEGPLMFKPPGILTPWRPAYFILKAGVLYQFSDACERLPHMIVEAGQCLGCVRLPPTHRPHAFQLLRKGAAPLLLAASDEHQASLWLQALLTTINTGMRDVSERNQVACRVVLLESGVMLTQQSNIFLGLSPQKISSAHNPEGERSSGTQGAMQFQQQQYVGAATTQTPPVLEKKENVKPTNLAVSNLKDRKPLSASLTGLNCTNSLSSIPGSPRKHPMSGERSSANPVSGERSSANPVSGGRSSTQPMCGERSSTAIHNSRSHHRHQFSLTKVPDSPVASVSPERRNSTSKLHVASLERRHSASKLLYSPLKQKPGQSKMKNEIPSESKKMPANNGFKGNGELKILTFSSLEHLSSVSLYAECPTTCLLEFECSEAGEISGDWALYFRTSRQLQAFVSALSATWRAVSELEFPLHRVANEGVKQFLLEGSQISANRWSCLHL